MLLFAFDMISIEFINGKSLFLFKRKFFYMNFVQKSQLYTPSFFINAFVTTPRWVLSEILLVVLFIHDTLIHSFFMFRVKYFEFRIRILTRCNSTEINESMNFHAIFLWNCSICKCKRARKVDTVLIFSTERSP